MEAARLYLRDWLEYDIYLMRNPHTKIRVDEDVAMMWRAGGNYYNVSIVILYVYLFQYPI